MSTTTILVWTSAKSAVLHSCQHGWRRLDVDTSELTPEQRELLASRVVEDQGARYGVRSMGCGLDGHAVDGFDVAPPTVEGLRFHLQRRLDEIASQNAEAARLRAERDANDDAKLASHLDRLQSVPVTDLIYTSNYTLRAASGLYLGAAIDRRFGPGSHAWTCAALVGREAEAKAAAAELQRAEQAKTEADSQAREDERLRNAAQLRAIVKSVAPEILPMLDADCAREADITSALFKYACWAFDIDPDDTVDVDRYDYTIEHYTRAQWDTLQTFQKRARAIDGTEVKLVRSYEPDDESRTILVITTPVAGYTVTIELPID
jgi:hypothetical protein